MEKLFGNKIQPACKYCAENFKSIGETQVLCQRKGVVLADYSCRRFLYDPLKRIPKVLPELPVFSDEEFTL